jgi:hypothetical protein
MAMAVAEGVSSMKGVVVNFKDACEAGMGDLLSCDGIECSLAACRLMGQTLAAGCAAGIY